MIITKEIADKLGLTSTQAAAINAMFAFVKFKTISELQEAADPFDGYFPIDKGGGELEKIKASVFYQLIGNVAKPISPSDPTPTVSGWYKPQISSELDKPSDPNSPTDWGEKYPNAGNLRAKSGFDTLFHFSGTNWKRTETKLPGSTAKKEFDPTNDNDPSTMKAAGDRWDKLLTAVNYFVQEGAKQSVSLANTTHGYVKRDGTIVSADQYVWYQKVPVSGFNRILYNGYVALVDAVNIPTYSSLLIEKSDGTFTSLLDPSPSAAGNKIINKYFNLPDNAAFAYISWSNYQAAAGTIPTCVLEKTPYLETDSLKKYMDNNFQVLDSFINPTETIWEEIVMPQAGEVDEMAMNGGFVPINGPGFAYGAIKTAGNLVGYDLIKIEGGLDQFSGLWLWAHMANAGSVKLLEGRNSGSFTFNIDSTKYDEYGYTRYKSQTKIYKGKIVKKPIEKDSVMKFILENSGGSNAGEINAFSEFGVKPSNTASENSIRLNSAISAGHAQKKAVIIPSGVIKHEGINYIQDVVLKGAGMRLTTLSSTTAVSALKSGVRADDPYFSLAVGSISDMTIEGNDIGTIGIEVQNVANSRYDNLLIKGFKEWCMTADGFLISELNNVFFQSSKRGARFTKSTNSGFGLMQANLLVFNRCNFIVLPELGIELSYGANYTFNNCSIDRTGTDGVANTGFMYAHDLSPNVAGGMEGVDITMNQCWFEGLHGEFAIKLENCKGVTTLRDTMLWNLGTCKKGLVNNGSRVLITGSTRATTFTTTDIETSNNGQTRVDGWSVVGSHQELTGGTFKTATYS